MNGSNEILKLNIDVSLFRGMIEDILDEKFKVFESRLQSNSVALTREDASNMLKVTPNTISQYVKEGKLKNRGVGKKILFFKSDIEDYMKYKNNN
jgi:excisionase family DNA binding protein